VGSVITPVSANERLARLEDITISEEEPTFLYALSTDAALVGVPNNPNRIVPDVLIVEEEPSWLGQNTAVSGSWVQFGPKREGLAAIGQGNHLPDSYMLPINGRQKLLPFTNYAKNIRNIRFEKFSCKGSSSAAIDDKGVLYTWGFRTDIGDFESLLESNIKFLDIIHTYPTPVLNPNEYSGPWKDTTTAGFSLFAIDANDRLWVRGNTNDDGQLGLGNFLPSAELKLVLTPINHSGKWKKVFANEQFCLGLDANDKLWSWGRNQSGQLGISETGEETNKNIPTLVIDPDGWNGAKWVQASAGGSHSLGIDDQGRAWAWGNNAVGELGTGEDGPGTGKSIPTRVIDPEDWNEAKWIQVSAGGQYSLGIDDQGRAWAWGENDDGELGTGEDGSGTNKNIPTLVIDPEGWNGAKWIQVSAGSSHSLGIDDQGRAWAWGGNTAGELGTGEAGPGTEKNTPTLIGNEYWIQIEASNQQLLNISLALDNNNNIWAWGYNFFGQLGLNQSENLIFIDSNFSFRTFFSDPPDKNVPTKLNYYITKPISTELGRTRYVRQFGTEPLEHGIILVSSTPSSQQAWKALGNGSNQVILWSLIAVQVP
jgi:alpha-tubulin suppressor-like RCC1 family protein